MPHVFLRHSFALKHVTEVATAVSTGDFDPPHSKRNVGVATHCAGDFVVDGSLRGRVERLGTAVAAQ